MQIFLGMQFPTPEWCNIPNSHTMEMTTKFITHPNVFFEKFEWATMLH
jgi:hypothetical protein